MMQMLRGVAQTIAGLAGGTVSYDIRMPAS